MADASPVFPGMLVVEPVGRERRATCPACLDRQTGRCRHDRPQPAGVEFRRRVLVRDRMNGLRVCRRITR